MLQADIESIDPEDEGSQSRLQPLQTGQDVVITGRQLRWLLGPGGWPVALGDGDKRDEKTRNEYQSCQRYK